MASILERLRAAVDAFRSPQAPAPELTGYCPVPRCCLPAGHSGDCDEVYP